MAQTTQSQIVDFFADKTIFLTGSTGFLGKLLIDKLIRVCQIRKIFLIVREKRGKTQEERFHEMFDCPVFDRLRSECPNFKSKVQLVTGDCEKENLGISPVNWSRVQAETNIVLHCAATIRFDQALRIAYNINIRATRDLLRKCQGMPNLQCFVHVSTAYTNCVRKEVGEICYPTHLSDTQLESILNAIEDDDIIKSITPDILGKWPNTYTFTKCIAENMVSNMGKDFKVPIAIFRPSIVVSTYTEPIPGWIVNYNGPIGALYAMHLGLIRTANCASETLSDFIPADYVINAILAIGWQIVTKRMTNVPVYNYVAGKEAINCEIFFGDAVRYIYNLPETKGRWYLTFTFQPETWKFNIVKFILHVVPAHAHDLYLRAIGKNPTTVQTYQKMQKYMNVVNYFMAKQWDFTTTNARSLWKDFNDEDKKLFEVRLEKFDWADFREGCFRGAFKYLYKLPHRTDEEANQRHRNLLIIHWILMILLLLVFLYVGSHVCKILF